MTKTLSKFQPGSKNFHGRVPLIIFPPAGPISAIPTVIPTFNSGARLFYPGRVGGEGERKLGVLTKI
jgi:hypothetical protein